MTPEMLDRLTRELTADFGLSAADAEAVRQQAQRICAGVEQLDELPLDGVEPAPLFKVVP